MLSKERKVRIMEQIRSCGFVSIKDLMEEFHVSKSSINRDLIDLENQGLITRSRGGACAKDADLLITSMNETGIHDKSIQHMDAKKALCQACSSLIKDGDCIFIDAGTTAAFIPEFLHGKKVKLVTTSIYTLRHLPEDFAGEVILLGGHYLIDQETTGGHVCEKQASVLHFDHAFFTTNGVDLDLQEVMTFDYPAAGVKETVLERSKTNSLLIDESKLSLSALVTWADFKDFDYIFIAGSVEKDKLCDNMILIETS